MTDDDLMRLARKHEGTDPSDDIPEVVALTPLELAALAKVLRRTALEEAANHITRGVDGVKQNGWIDAANERLRCAAAIRALSQKTAQGEAK